MVHHLAVRPAAPPIVFYWRLTSYYHRRISTLFRRLPMMSFTGHMSNCCDSILEAKQFDTDEFLVALVRLERMAARIHRLLPIPEIDDPEAAVFRGPLDMAMSTMRREIEEYEKSLPEAIRANRASSSFGTRLGNGPHN